MKWKKVNLRDIDTKQHSGEHSHDDGHSYSGPEEISDFRTYLPAIVSFVMLIAGIAIDYFDAFPFFKGWIRIVWYTVAYIPFGLPVIREGCKKGDFFTGSVIKYFDLQDKIQVENWIQNN